MPVLRHVLTSVASAACAYAAVSAAGCGTDAVGVDSCRQIERARCEAGQRCGLITDVASCQRFYRDHCLHGVALASEPNSQDVGECVEAINAAGQCAERSVDTSIDDCDGLGALSPDADFDNVCDAVVRPEALEACRFLVPEPPEEEPEGQAGAPGAAGASSAAGAAGAAGTSG